MIEKFNIPDAFLMRFEKIDEQHQELVDILNRCVYALSSNSFNIFEEEISKFCPLAVSHFKYEEDLMLAAGYDALESHIDHHRVALEHLSEISKRNHDSIEAKWYILQSMFDNIVMDITKADLKFDEFLIASGRKLTRVQYGSAPNNS